MQTAAAVRRAVGAVLAALCCAGIVHAARSSAAQWIYCNLKYGGERPLSSALGMFALADRLYPWNFYLPAWAAEQAYTLSFSGEPGERARWRNASRLWCERSLALNPYKRNMNVLKARLLQAESPARALEFWRGYVEWQYWSRHNHALLAELCAATGEFAEAARELEMARGGSDYEGAKARVMDAWAKEKRPPVLTGGRGKGLGR